MVQISLQNSRGKVVFLGRFHGTPPKAPTGVKVPWSLSVNVRSPYNNHPGGTNILGHTGMCRCNMSLFPKWVSFSTENIPSHRSLFPFFFFENDFLKWLRVSRLEWHMFFQSKSEYPQWYHRLNYNIRYSVENFATAPHLLTLGTAVIPCGAVTKFSTGHREVRGLINLINHFTGLYHLFWSSHAMFGVSHCLMPC